MNVPLVQKFKVERNPEPYPPHEGEYFVLFPMKDYHAYKAMVAYAESVREQNPDLAAQILEWVDDPARRHD